MIDLSKDRIFQEIIGILDTYYKIKVHMIPGFRNSKSYASSRFDFDQYIFRFSTHRGLIEIMFPDDNLVKVIEKTIARGARTTNPSYPSETNILEWLGNEYLHLYNTSKKGNPFTDGYKQYDPNDGKGRGSKKEWKSAFGDFNDFADEEEANNFRNFKGRSYADASNPFNDFYNNFFKGKGNSQQQKQQSSSSGQQKTSSTSPHSILGLDPLIKPTEEELKKAYRKKCLEWHPDRNQHRLSEADEMMKKINNANETLKSAYGYK